MKTRINAYLNSLDNQGDEMIIESGSSCIKARRTADNRVSIIDIIVPEADQGQGISRELFNRLKQELPSGVRTLDLHDNINPGFWQHIGFRNGIYYL